MKMECSEGMRDELIKGEAIISPAAKPNHALILKQLVRLLDAVIDKTKFEVSCDVSLVVEPSDPATMPRPDVFVMNRARFRAAAAEDRYPEGPPELAVEFVSPSNTKGSLEDKIENYLTHGSVAVWVVYPKRRSVVVWEAASKSTEFVEGDEWPLAAGLSSRGIQISEIFWVLG